MFEPLESYRFLPPKCSLVDLEKPACRYNPGSMPVRPEVLDRVSIASVRRVGSISVGCCEPRVSGPAARHVTTSWSQSSSGCARGVRKPRGNRRDCGSSKRSRHHHTRPSGTVVHKCRSAIESRGPVGRLGGIIHYLRHNAAVVGVAPSAVRPSGVAALESEAQDS